MLIYRSFLKYRVLAQLIEEGEFWSIKADCYQAVAAPSGGKGHRFESYRARHYFSKACVKTQAFFICLHSLFQPLRRGQLSPIARRITTNNFDLILKLFMEFSFPGRISARAATG